jgi:hypothetical protein
MLPLSAQWRDITSLLLMQCAGISGLSIVSEKRNADCAVLPTALAFRHGGSVHAWRGPDTEMTCVDLAPRITSRIPMIGMSRWSLFAPNRVVSCLGEGVLPPERDSSPHPDGG